MSIFSSSSDQSLLTTSIPSFPNLNIGFTSTATAGATTTLTATSNQQQNFTGTLTQTVVMPVTSTLVLGQHYVIKNTSTGVVTVQSSGANTIKAMPSNSILFLTCISTSGTTAASWDATNLAEAGGGLAWVSASSTPITATVNTGYVITDASQVTITLPATAAIGSVVRIAGSGGSGWILAPNSGQTIFINGSSAGTSITSGGATDCIEVVCTFANTNWVAASYVTKVGFTLA